MAKQKFNYSKSLKEIEEIVKQIESGELDVDKLADKVQKATKLIDLGAESLWNIQK